MKRKLALAIVLALIPTSAWAECTTGNCGVDINCTTGEVTYYDVRINDKLPEPMPETIVPTHQVTIQTQNDGIGISGSYESVQAELARIATPPQEPGIDPCAAGGCTKMIVNVATGEVQVLPLSAEDLAERAMNRQWQYQSQLALALAAQAATITPINSDPAPSAALDTSAPTADPVAESLAIAPALMLETAYLKVAKSKPAKVKKIKKAKKAKRKVKK